MQGKVANMQNAFKGGAVKKGGNLFAMAASVVAFISTAGMIALFLADDDAALQEAASVISKVKKLEANEEFYLGLKKRLEDENKELVDREKDVNKEKEELANNLSDAMTETQDLRMQLKKVEDELSEAKDDLVRAKKSHLPNQFLSQLAKSRNWRKRRRIKLCNGPGIIQPWPFLFFSKSRRLP